MSCGYYNESSFKNSVPLMQLLYLHVVPCRALSIRSCTVLVASLADFETSLEVILRVL
jgi:hypothetical protein